MTHVHFQSQVLEILIYLVQPLEERLRPTPPTPGPSLLRPATAMTDKERERALKNAVNNMSDKVRDVIKDALEDDDEKNIGKTGKISPKQNLRPKSSRSRPNSSIARQKPAQRQDSRYPKQNSLRPNSSSPKQSANSHKQNSSSDFCTHSEQELRTKSSSPLMENMTKEEIDAEFEAIEEDLEEGDHPIDMINTKDELVNNDGDDDSDDASECARSVIRLTIATANPNSDISPTKLNSTGAMYGHDHYRSFARKSPPRGAYNSVSAQALREGAQTDHDTTDKTNPKKVSPRKPWSTTLRNSSPKQPGSAQNQKPRQLSAKVKHKPPVRPNSVTKRPKTPVKTTSSSRERNNNWKTKVVMCRPLAEQCRERIVASVGTSLISELFSTKESTKIDTLDFLHEYISYGKVKIFYFFIIYIP